MMDNKLYIICWKYAPTTAIFQRNYALAQGLVNHGVNVACVYLMSSGEQPTEKDSVRHVLLGDSNKKYGKILCLLISIFQMLKLVKNDKIILSSLITPLMLVMQWFKGRNLYIESNEFPPYVLSKKRFGRLQLLIYLYVCRRCAGILTISKGLKKYFISQGVDESRIEVVNMVVDTKRFDTIEKEIGVEQYVAYCGTVSNFKDGVDVLLQSFALLSIQKPDIKLYILGKTPRVCDRDRNAAIIEENCLKDKVFMPGEVSGYKMPAYLKNAQVLALARPDNVQAKYGFPTKLGEYLLTGNPVLLTDVGEMNYYLQDGYSCIFAKPNDPVDFSSKLLWILDHPEEAAEIGRRGREVALANFNGYTESLKMKTFIYG